DASADFEGNLEQVITQKWIANYPMGKEASTEWRRTGYPELAPVIDNRTGNVITDDKRGMRRLRYSFNEQSLNKENYANALQLLGGADNEATDLFWAKR
ncbi:MAG: SusD/RagB family nutrient-binding outer membrane lipoprotein, partial [Bacteroidales bacterium]|nr:SusD/RagB family nutrient-binding outer membrane lipoprotein [Bacteroidales bacterium]